MCKFIGLHGVLTNGKSSIGKLLEELNYNHGWLTFHPSYFAIPLLGYFSFFRRLYIKQTLKYFCDGDHIIAHSGGCTITLWLLQELKKQGKKAGNIWFLNAALDRDTIFPENTYDNIYNFHEDEDTVLFISKFVPFHSYGTMGRSGYNGASKNVINYSEIVPNYHKTAFRHSDFFKSPAKEKICQHITANSAKITKYK